jgi:DNA-binding GntR family transcriptional regulator
MPLPLRVTSLRVLLFRPSTPILSDKSLRMATKMTLDRGRQAAPQLYELLRRKIIDLELAPGAALSRVELAAEFNVSQTPVREALLRLAEERLVEVFPQSSTRVELVRELALEHAPSLTDDLDALLHEQEALRDAGDLAGFTQADMAFHRALYLALDKETLWYLVRSRSGHLDRLRRLHLPVGDKPDRILADHRRIVDGIRRHEPSAAQQALREHLSGTLEYVERIQADHPELLKPE